MKNKILGSLVWLSIFHSTILFSRPSFTYNSIYYLAIDKSLQYKIIPAPGNTWGYDILKDDKIFIHQPNKPGMPGTQGFATKQDAIKVARLVITKIQKGEMPPTVSQEELKALKLKN